MGNETIEERVAKLESDLKNLEDRLQDFDKRLNAVFKRIDDIRADMHELELSVLREISAIKTSIDKLASDIRWYGRIPTLAFSSLSFISTLLILLKLLGLLQMGGK